MKASLLEGERERERAYEYVVSRFPQIDTESSVRAYLVPI